jgi:hypothetical protein
MLTPQGCQRSHSPQDAMSLVGSPPNGDPSKQVAVQTTCSPWILGMQTNAKMWKHKTWPILFTLVVDNFGVKYVNKADVNHLIKCLKQKYKLTKDWDRSLYCGIKLNWNYNNPMLDILMPGYIIKQLQKCKHTMPAKPQHCPYTPQPRQYGRCPLPLDTPPPPLGRHYKIYPTGNRKRLVLCVSH